MLLIVTIGLVLVAAVTLVIGFVSNTLAPIIVSIICSFLAAVVLSIFYRMNRGRRVATGGRPSPLVDTTPPVFSRTTPAPSPRRQGPKVVTGGGSSAPASFAEPPQYDEDQPRFAEPPVTADRPTRPFRRVPPAAPAPPPPAPVPAQAPAPVAAEPVEAPAPAPRPEPLAVAEASPDAGPAGATSMASRPAPVAAAASPAPPAAAPAPAAPAWDDSLPFPIEEYDDLRVVEIIPLLPELDDGELGAVRAYEQNNRNRVAVLSRIDSLLSEGGEAEPEDEGMDAVEEAAPTSDDLPIADYDFLGVSEILALLGELDDDELAMVRQYEDEGRGRATIVYRIDSLLDASAAAEAPAPAAAPEPPPEPPAAAPEPAPAAPSGSGLPLADYDRLRVFQILSMLGELDDDELQAVREYEQAGRGRITILNEIDTLLAGGAPMSAAPPAEAPAPPAATAAPEPAEAPEAEDEDWRGLPIADYDSLSQGEILPLLDELDDDELEQVQDYEDANRARVAILFRIGSLLNPDGTEAEAPEVVAPEAEAEEAEAEEAEAEEDEEPDDAEGADEVPEAAEDDGGGADAGPDAEGEEVWGDLPIADYDDLSQGEILPLLDELYDDELEDLRDYEESRRGRVAILYRIDALLAAEQEPEAEAEAEAEEAEEPEAESEPPGEADEGAGAAPEPPADSAAEQGGAIDAADLPIADYDLLTVSEILPLLAELDDDELEDVRDYEDAYLGRTAIVARIDALLEPYEEPESEEEFEDDAEGSDEASEAEPAAEDEEPDAEDEEPDAEAEAEATEPAAEELEAEPAAEDEEPDAEEPAADEPAAEEEVAEEDYEDDDEEDYEPEDVASADEDDDTFPIADYDDLRVGEILPLLSQLHADELELVARHEEQLANRSAILNRIERLLQLAPKDGN